MTYLDRAHAAQTSADFREAMELMADIRACVTDAPHRYGCTCPLCPGRRIAPILALPWDLSGAPSWWVRQIDVWEGQAAQHEALAARDPR